MADRTRCTGRTRKGEQCRKGATHGDRCQQHSRSTEQPELSPRQVSFLSAFGMAGNVLHAANAVGISRSTHYAWLDDDEYAARFADAQEDAGDRLEHEAFRRGVLGVDEPVFYQGEPCGEIRRYSDTLLGQLLKANRPAKFRERTALELHGEVHVPELSDSAEQRLLEQLDAYNQGVSEGRESSESKP